ncbi:hypothetical protein C7B62_19310 [Pleurocapsa sp. CCALA 161]|uniref:hypothetical protein n=1 Tax=Pleurocapsa sp. CCALA 161 TaxID=2107688 RepID=UPI000D05AD35|nr:hypothetical protein [Pleurocapsa sp. CCALA 161]PSB07616.1 hypothetical protein C7B62_19310 [Pleurocapsa sp. CCALA 161]
MGKDAPTNLGDTQISKGVVDYDDTVTSDRILASADLYYICIHEFLGVFRVMNKLQELFRAGTLRISSGEEAYNSIALTDVTFCAIECAIAIYVL